MAKNKRKTACGKQSRTTQGISFDSAQDRQDEIFRNMSADEKIQLGSELWQLAKELVGDKINYASKRS